MLFLSAMLVVLGFVSPSVTSRSTVKHMREIWKTCGSETYDDDPQFDPLYEKMAAMHASCSLRLDPQTCDLRLCRVIAQEERDASKEFKQLQEKYSPY